MNGALAGAKPHEIVARASCPRYLPKRERQAGSLRHNQRVATQGRPYGSLGLCIVYVAHRLAF